MDLQITKGINQLKTELNDYIHTAIIRHMGAENLSIWLGKDEKYVENILAKKSFTESKNLYDLIQKTSMEKARSI